VFFDEFGRVGLFFGEEFIQWDKIFDGVFDGCGTNKEYFGIFEVIKGCFEKYFLFGV
jgi:hypothetical protein